MESQTGSGESRSLHRAIDVLEFLARTGRPVTLAEITETVDSPKATLHRLLATLQSRGYVSQEPRSGRYAVGIRCFELGSMWAQNLDLRMVAAPLLGELNERTGEMVHLAVYEHGDVVYVDKLESSQPIAPRSYVGRRCPAYCVSTGRALLAFMPADEIERVLAEPLPSYTEQTLTDPEELLALLEDVRRTGFATNAGSYRDGVCGIAAPVRDHTGGVVASVGCCLPESRFGGERFDLLRDATVMAAAAISGRLGWVLAEGTPAAAPASTTTGGRRPGP